MKIQYFDNLRAVACFLVILTHSAMPAIDLAYGPYMVFFSILCSPSSELFVTMSSSLLAPTKQDMLGFYKKRFSKLIPPFFIWSVIVLLVKLFQNKLSFNEAFTKLVLFPIAPVEGVYWFVYAICALYLIIPLISPWLKNCSRKELLLVLGFWFITLLLPYLNLIFNKEIYRINGDYEFILIYVGGFIGYLFLGVYFRRYPIILKTKLKTALLVLALCLLGTFPIFFSYYYNRDYLDITFNNLSLSSAFYVSAFFVFFQNFKFHESIESILSLVAKYSFGIYLMHILVIRDVVWLMFESNRFHPLAETPIIALVSLFMSLGICKLISFLPNSKYIIGV